MKKLNYLLFALVCAATVNSCTLFYPPDEEAVRTNLPGVWKLYRAKGETIPTDNTVIREYSSDGTGKVTYSYTDAVTDRIKWHFAASSKYTLKRNRITEEYNDNAVISDIVDISSNEQTRNIYGVSTADHEVEPDITEVYVKMPGDLNYGKLIQGTWQGLAIVGEETYGDENHRWEFKADGTYLYYRKSTTGSWIPDRGEYKVIGDWLNFKWAATGDPSGVFTFESWNIEYLDSQNMVWDATRKKGDGTTFSTSITLEKIK